MVTMASDDPPEQAAPPHLVTPLCVELRPSAVAEGLLGAWCKEPIEANQKFGPFAGEVMVEDARGEVDYRYAWEVFDKKTGKLMHIINATTPEVGNWMRYVNCARFFEEQNIVSVQEGCEIFYEALKDIAPGEELLTWFDPQVTRRNRKRRRVARSVSSVSDETPKQVASRHTNPPATSSEDKPPPNDGKRKRKKKVVSDMLSLDDDDVIYASSGAHRNKIRTGASSGLRRSTSLPDGKMMIQKPLTPKMLWDKTPSVGNHVKPLPVNLMKPIISASVKPQSEFSTDASRFKASNTEMFSKRKSVELVSTSSQVNTQTMNLTKSDTASEEMSQCMLPSHKMRIKRSISEIVASITAKKEKECKIEAFDSVELTHGSRTGDKSESRSMMCSAKKQSQRLSVAGKADMEETSEFQFVFELKDTHKESTRDTKKAWICDVCDLRYHQALSLKRHYLRNHLNHKYLSKGDIGMCKTTCHANFAAAVEADADPDADDPELNDERSTPVPEANETKTEDRNALQHNNWTKKEGMVEERDALSPDTSKEIDLESSTKEESDTVKETEIIQCKSQKHTSKRIDLEGNTKEESDVKETEMIQCRSQLEPHRVPFSYQGISGVEDAFRCFLCVQLFPSVERLKQHIQNDAHRYKGDKQFGCERCNQRFRFQHNYLHHVESHGPNGDELSCACHICGKKFLNEANMRKHLRFHSGRNFPCKYGCVDVVYPNVAELVKHLRMVHPDRPKKSTVINHSEASSDSCSVPTPILKAKKSKVLSKSPNDKNGSKKEEEFVSEAESLQAWIESRPPGWVETRGRKPRPGVVGVHCTICKKKFSTYGSMCRHRRSVHRLYMSAMRNKPGPSDSILSKTETENGFLLRKLSHIETSVEEEYRAIEERMEQIRQEEEGEEMHFSPPPSPTTFYANVSNNIVANLSCFLDGGPAALQSARQHITVEDYIPLQEQAEYPQGEDVDWSRYNFPPFFMLVDPVIPYPPVPPAVSTTKLSLFGEERTSVYHTRAAVASENEASRRGSVESEVTVTSSAADSLSTPENSVFEMFDNNGTEDEKGVPEVSSVSESMPENVGNKKAHSSQIPVQDDLGEAKATESESISREVMKMVSVEAAACTCENKRDESADGCLCLSKNGQQQEKQAMAVTTGKQKDEQKDDCIKNEEDRSTLLIIENEKNELKRLKTISYGDSLILGDKQLSLSSASSTSSLSVANTSSPEHQQTCPDMDKEEASMLCSLPNNISLKDMLLTATEEKTRQDITNMPEVMLVMEEILCRASDGFLSPFPLSSFESVKREQVFSRTVDTVKAKRNDDSLQQPLSDKTFALCAQNKLFVSTFPGDSSEAPVVEPSQHSVSALVQTAMPAVWCNIRDDHKVLSSDISYSDSKASSQGLVPTPDGAGHNRIRSSLEQAKVSQQSSLAADDLGCGRSEMSLMMNEKSSEVSAVKTEMLHCLEASIPCVAKYKDLSPDTRTGDHDAGCVSPEESSCSIDTIPVEKYEESHKNLSVLPASTSHKASLGITQKSDWETTTNLQTPFKDDSCNTIEEMGDKKTSPLCQSSNSTLCNNHIVKNRTAIESSGTQETRGTPINGSVDDEHGLSCERCVLNNSESGSNKKTTTDSSAATMTKKQIVSFEAKAANFSVSEKEDQEVNLKGRSEQPKSEKTVLQLKAVDDSERDVIMLQASLCPCKAGGALTTEAVDKKPGFPVPLQPLSKKSVDADYLALNAVTELTSVHLKSHAENTSLGSIPRVEEKENNCHREPEPETIMLKDPSDNSMVDGCGLVSKKEGKDSHLGSAHVQQVEINSSNLCLQKTVVKTELPTGGPSLQSTTDKMVLCNTAMSQEAPGRLVAKDCGPISEQEMEYMCKGLLFYVRMGSSRCPHITSKCKSELLAASVPEVPGASVRKDQLIKALDLAVGGQRVVDGCTRLCPSEQKHSRECVVEKSCQASDISTRFVNVISNENSHEGYSLELHQKAEQKDDPSPLEIGKDLAATQGSDHACCSKKSYNTGATSADQTSGDISDSDSELLDLIMDLELRKRQEQEAVDEDAEGACSQCLHMIRFSSSFQSPAKMSTEEYERIRFGKNGKNGLVYCVCSMCRRYYGSLDYLIRHQWKKHPSVVCSHMEVELGHNLEMLFYPEPSVYGVLAQTILLPNEHLSLENYTCTRCNASFKQYGRLRAHIVHCDPNTPVTSHARRKKRNRNRHRFMEQMFSVQSSTNSVPQKMQKMGLGQKQAKCVTYESQSLKSINRKKLAVPGSGFMTQLSSQTRSFQCIPSLFRTVGKESKSGFGTAAKSSLTRSFSVGSSSLSFASGRNRKRRNYELLYNPAAHVRRRDAAECIEKHQCRGCGLRCKTLSLLERHARKCSGKDKLQSQRPVMNRFPESPDETRKHECRYCPKRFTYLKGVANHYRTACHARAEKEARGSLTAEDQEHEAELLANIQLLAWNKAENRDHSDVIQGRAHLLDDGTITLAKQRGGWPKGRKRGNKRRCHGWTSIKRRKTNDDSNSASPIKDEDMSAGSGSVSQKKDADVRPSCDKKSALSKPMSELEAKLRDPEIGAGRENDSSSSKKVVPQSTGFLPKSQATRPVELLLKPNQRSTICQGVKKIFSGSHSTIPLRDRSCATGQQKPSTVDDDSEAPVIEPVICLKNEQHCEQVSPDLEPPTLSPMSPLPRVMDNKVDVPQSNLAMTAADARKRRRKGIPTHILKPNRLEVGSSCQVFQSSETHELPQGKGEADVPVLNKSDIRGAAKRKWENNANLYARPKTSRTKTTQPAEFKMMQLKMPYVVRKFHKSPDIPEPKFGTKRCKISSGIACVKTSVSCNMSVQSKKSNINETLKDEKLLSRSVPSNVSMTMMTSSVSASRSSNILQTKLVPLPPNFLFPAPASDVFLPCPVKPKTSTREEGSGSTGDTKTKRRRSRKHPTSTELTTSVFTGTTTTLTSAIKVRNSATVTSTASLSPQKLQVFKLAQPVVAAASSAAGGISSGKSVPPAVLTPLVSASGVAVLPPGAMLAVLPSSPILLQTTPATSTTTATTTSASTVPANIAATNALQAAVATGKVLIALDPRNFQMCLQPAGHGITTGTPVLMKSGVVSSPLTTLTCSKDLPGGTLTSTAGPKLASSIPDGMKDADIVASSASKLRNQKPTVPNFLFVNTEELTENPPAQNSQDSNVKEPKDLLFPDCSSTKVKACDRKVLKSPKREKKKSVKGRQQMSSPGAGNKIKSMSLMMAPGITTYLSLLSPTVSHQSAHSKTQALPAEATAVNKDCGSTSAEKEDSDLLVKTTDKMGIIQNKQEVKASLKTSLKVPQEGNISASVCSDSQSDDDVPLSQMARKKDK